MKKASVICALLVCVTAMAAGNCSFNITSYPLPYGSKQANAIAFSPDGQYLASCDTSSNTVILYNVLQGGRLDNAMTYPLPPGCLAPLAIVFSPDGKYVYTANRDSYNIVAFDLDNGALVNPIITYLPPGSAPIASMALSPDGRYLVTANQWLFREPLGDVTIFIVLQGGELNYGTTLVPIKVPV